MQKEGIFFATYEQHAPEPNGVAAAGFGCKTN
jgi:hypothetical protein